MSIESRIAAAATPLARARRLDPAAVCEILEVDHVAGPAETCDDVDQLGALYERSKGATGARAPRKGDGIYYTPRSLVQPTVRRTLTPLDSVRAVCDPAAGAGAFLLAALRVLAGANSSADTRASALQTVFGVDRDPVAVRVARLCLWLEVANPDLDPDTLTRHVRVGDSCVGSWHHGANRAAGDSFCRQWFDAAHEPFHWPAEFAGVFARGGFDAIVGNPPWNIEKPDSREFFARVDPAYPTLPKQDALARQRDLLRSDSELAQDWHARVEYHRALGRFVREAESPFRRQGRGDVNGYKLFVELAWELLRDGGRLGLIVPSGIYSDAGSRELRTLLLDESRWEWLFGFENRRRVFPIDGRFKFAAIVAERGASTDSLRAAFMRTDPSEWERAETLTLSIRASEIRSFSPRTLAIPEVRDPRDREILECALARSHPFGAELGSTVRYRRELDQTSDSDKFVRRDELEARGFTPNAHGDWVRDAAVAVPLYEGRMIGAYDFSEKGWVRGAGRRAVWEPIEFPDKRIAPQFLLPVEHLPAADDRPDRPKIAFMAIASATNRRSMVATSLLGVACGNSVPTLRGTSILDDLCILAVLNSYVFDFLLRMRLAGTNLNRFVLDETPMLDPEHRVALRDVATDVAALAWCDPRFDAAWRASGLPREHALAPDERRRRRARVDAAVAHAFGLSREHLDWILRDCVHPVADLASRSFLSNLDPKGFWRDDRDLEPTERLAYLVIRQFERETKCESSSAEQAV